MSRLDLGSNLMAIYIWLFLLFNNHISSYVYAWSCLNLILFPVSINRRTCLLLYHMLVYCLISISACVITFRPGFSAGLYMYTPDRSVAWSRFQFIHACVYELRWINCLMLVPVSYVYTCPYGLVNLTSINLIYVLVYPRLPLSASYLSEDASPVHLFYWSHAFMNC